MYYYEVLIANSRYHSVKPLTYSSTVQLRTYSIVTVPMQNRAVTAFVLKKVAKPNFNTKAVKTLISTTPLPRHCLDLASWMSDYYCINLAEALGQFTPNKPVIRRNEAETEIIADILPEDIKLDQPLTNIQKQALKTIKKSDSTSILLHGDTGSGKTRIYLELAKQTLKSNKSVIILTPEIALTSQLATTVKRYLNRPSFVLHSQLSDAKRKKIWLEILESKDPVVVIGPRSALFSPINNLGLVVLDEAHEPAYKQEQSPRYHASRVASQLGKIADSRIIFGTATPSITDYYLASEHDSVVRMNEPAIKHSHGQVMIDIIDLKNRPDFSRHPHLSNQLIDVMQTTLNAKKQVLLYLNRRGSARLIICGVCGWQLVCPNCDIPMVYHADQYITRCHTCGFELEPPQQCPKCQSPDVIYRSIGTKALMESVMKLFPDYKIARFDSDNLTGEHLNELYQQLYTGKINILIGTQLLAKGLDLPKLGLVGIVAAETSLALPDFTAEERAFQLLYQVIGRVGRGHSQGHVIIQSYDPKNIILKSAINRDYALFYEHALLERQKFIFPPFAYLLRLSCRRLSEKGAEGAANKLRAQLLLQKLPVQIVGPAPSFYARRGKYYYYQLVVKSKNRTHLKTLASLAPKDWVIDLDPINLL